ncbi:hypothetical protein [Cellulomonas sp. URHE0023]|uniref:hypothetical protein n=1 Tax=Cellulomonas sp. URHE0023 TaxID=1380354 RepID=UPI000482AD63|nr:hypothetical protein [Cellulomonas sp. URHE0023]
MTAVRKPNGVVRILGILTMVAGGIFLVAGAVTWGAVSSNLKDEKITVSPDAAHFGGSLVDTPWEAFSQADIIKHHALTATDGKTYSEIGNDLHAIEAANPDATKAELAENADYAKATALRTVVMNGSFLRASLFTSVIAFGVAALVMGLGVVFGMVGYAITRCPAAAKVTAPAALV